MGTTKEEDLIEGEIIDAAASTKALLIKRKGYFIRIILIVIGIDVALAVLGAPFSILYFLPWVWPLLAYSSMSSKILIEFLKEFAKTNGYTFADTGPYGVGRIFNIGHSRRASNIIAGERNGLPFAFYSYSYTVGRGKNASRYSFTVFSIEMKTPLPPLFLQSNRYPSGGYPMFSDLIKLKMEGDFNKHFTVLVRKDFEIEVLQLFTPDMMAYWIDKASRYSLEWNGENMYLCVPISMTSKKDITKLFEVSDHLVKKFLPILSGMKGGLIARHAVENKS
ncbi:MAG: hypothetical protein KA052_00810 [Candidatus Pacebacteria bacterium]|nr:hypothetical protein [Candidatus Paceibacterota bacterium]